MKQILQSLSDGSSKIVELPTPVVSEGEILIETTCSLISSGTERMLVDFGKSNLIEKASKNPDKVKEVIEKARNDGIFNTLDSVKNKLDHPLPLGYCNVGVVAAIGKGVLGYKLGDRVFSNGPHAEVVVVPKNLCAIIPDNVLDETAVFTSLASIGLEGIRLANPNLGETFVVSGLGIIGLLTCQLLKANGCKVLGLDPDISKCLVAKDLGIEVLDLSEGDDPISWCLEKNEGIGVDGVLITAATTKSEPVNLAAKLCRKRGRIVLIGVTGLELRRDLFYKKELSFQVSCSYGPGRYDPFYEDQGNDYPIGFVRWTEQRNFQAVLELMSKKSIKVENLISHRFKFYDAPNAYDLLINKNSLGIILSYHGITDLSKRTITIRDSIINKRNKISNGVNISFIGSGNFASRTLIPCFKKVGSNLHTIASTNSMGPGFLGRKYSFKKATTDISKLILDDTSNTVVICTRHDSHANYIIDSLKAGKNVFVEKPLCLTLDELKAIKNAYDKDSFLMVGFNRRFSPSIIKLRKILLKIPGPKSFIYTCNSGFIDKDHWIQNQLLGGGRFIGEACHFVDLIRYLVQYPIEKLDLLEMKDQKSCPDTFSIQIKFSEGSIANINYFSNGNRSFPKERFEVFASGRILCLDNFRRLKAWGIPGYNSIKSIHQDKGHFNCVKSFVDAIKNGQGSPIPSEELFEVQEFMLNALSV